MKEPNVRSISSTSTKIRNASELSEFLRSFSVGERVCNHPKSVSSSSSDVSKDGREIDENQDAAVLRDYNDNSDNSRSSTPQSQDDDPAFDVITTNRQNVRDDVDSFFVRNVFLDYLILSVFFSLTARQRILNNKFNISKYIIFTHTG